MKKLIAHRGWSGKAPENTMSAIRMAMNEPKIESIEIDVHLTKDGIPVVIHDHSVDRTTNGNGYIREKEFQELKELDAGSWFGPSYSEETIPTLEEVLQAVGKKKNLYIELKQAANMYDGLEESVIRLIKQYEAEETSRLISFDHRSLKKCRDIEPNIERTLVYAGAPLLLTDQVNHLGAASVSMHHKFVDEQMVKELKENQTDIVVWTVDQEKDARRLYQLDSTISFTTNHPERLFD